MNKSTVLTLCAMAVSFVIGFTAFWFFAADRIEKGVAVLRDQALVAGVVLDGTFSPVTGFPGPQRLTFSGRIERHGSIVNVPALEISGLPLPRGTVTFSLPQGAVVESEKDPGLWSVKQASATFIVPIRLPSALTPEGLRSWRDHHGQLVVKKFSAAKESLTVNGNGVLMLDDRFQPTGSFNATATGFMAFLGYLQEKNLTDPRNALIASTVLNGLSVQDPKTGERTLNAVFTLQNRMLLLGPLMLTEVPPVQWGLDFLPGPSE